MIFATTGWSCWRQTKWALSQYMSITLIIAAVLIGALIRATFGFGEAVVSMPLLALLSVDLHTSISLVGLAGLTVALFTVASVWRDVEKLILIRLVIGVLIGIPLGLLLVIKLSVSIVTIGLGGFLIVYGSYSFWKISLAKVSQEPKITSEIVGSTCWNCVGNFRKCL